MCDGSCRTWERLGVVQVPVWNVGSTFPKLASATSVGLMPAATGKVWKDYH